MVLKKVIMGRKTYLLVLLVFFVIQISCNNNKRKEISRTSWMEGKYGVMVHWLSPNFDTSIAIKKKEPLAITREYYADLDKAVDAFDLDLFMNEFERTGASWLIFTIGQNTGTYASPNSVINSLCGPGHTPERDLVLEIAAAVKSRGKKFIAYLPCEIKANITLHKGFGWTLQEETDQAVFQRKYLKVVEEWSLRFSDLCDGWWFDGCYVDRKVFKNKFMFWDEWYKAARAGNKNAVLTFNDGSFLTGKMIPIRPEHDYSSGECLVLIDSKIRAGLKDDSPLFLPEQKYVPEMNCLYHALLPIDGYWSLHRSPFPDWANVPFEYTPPRDSTEMPAPIYSNEELLKFIKGFTQYGGAVTMNVNISQEGILSEKTIQQLEYINDNF